jgi:hypothetical protein
VAALVTLAVAAPASAGPYGDSLGKCLVESTAAPEKTALVRWMFAMMALHPDVQSSSAVTAAQRTAMSRETAKLFERLLTQACASQAREALRYEGQSTMQTSFSLLGQVAARELFTNPKVAEGLSELSKYLDENKIKALTAPSED